MTTQTWFDLVFFPAFIAILCFFIELIFIYLFDSGSIGDALLLSGAEEKAAWDASVFMYKIFASACVGWSFAYSLSNGQRKKHSYLLLAAKCNRSVYRSVRRYDRVNKNK